MRRDIAGKKAPGERKERRRRRGRERGRVRERGGVDPTGAGGGGGQQEERRQREKGRRRRRRQQGGREQRWRENGREERGLGFVTWGGVYCKSALRGVFYKNDRILEFFLLLVEIKISWRVYFVNILTWVGMFGAYLQFLDNRRSFLQNVQNKGCSTRITFSLWDAAVRAPGSSY